MTTQISWIAFDTHGPAAIYIAADSRITWENNVKWDYCRKVFYSSITPQIWGYCGDVLFPAIAIDQIASAIDEYSKKNGMDASSWHEYFIKLIQEQYQSFPAERKAPFSIFHCVREGKGVSGTFKIWEVSWNKKDEWLDKEITNQLFSLNPSPKPVVRGSGKRCFLSAYYTYKRSDISGTSRAVFQAFTDSMKRGVDIFSGGTPQMVCLRRLGNGIGLGIFWDNAPRYNGLKLNAEMILTDTEFYNENFERCDADKGQIQKDAQRQPKPI